MSEAPPGQNRLATESSPYLLQHADNPVDWYPWGEEAFARARAADLPVLLSVGYSSCHWCHVMAHESFENPAIAALMNEAFVSIKVDREERPDIDAVYMTATQALTGQGGWPMTVFMTAEGQPFYAGTYFPPDDGHGRPGFRRVLESLRDSWRNDRDRLLTAAGDITTRLQRSLADGGDIASDAALDASTTAEAVVALAGNYDAQWGGFGRAPKFPSPPTLEFLLAHHAATAQAGGGSALGSDGGALEMALHTLRRMAAGGVYDHLGGGFARYSVDERWLVPHFEKMLYDNAQLVRLYVHAYQVTGEASFEAVARETLAYLEREMLDAEGGFYSAQDADSEGIEGKYFVWTPAEVQSVLGDDAALFNAYYAVTEQGNFHDPHHPEFGTRSVLSTPRTAGEVAAELAIAVETLHERLPAMRERMLAERERRVRPGLDDKVLTSWNGLALAAFAEAGRVLGDERYLAVAQRNAQFVRRALWLDGRLLHSYRQGVAKIDGMLEDYAYYGLGLVELYRATGDLDQLRWASDLLAVLLDRFRDPEAGGFFDTASDAERLLLRQKPLFDAATPSGNGAAALLVAWLGRYFSRDDWERTATATVDLVRDRLAMAASGFGSSLLAAELLLSPPREIAIVGAAEERASLERAVARRFLPHTVIAPSSGGGGLPVLEQREASGGAAAYVCENMVCRLPVTDATALARELDAISA